MFLQETYPSILFWLYLIQITILICHEIESAYWQEWKLFNLPGGVSFFVIVHVPVVFLFLFGVNLLHEKSSAGIIIAIISGIAGILGFFIHRYFIKKGKEGFDLAISKILLYAMLLNGILVVLTSAIILLGF